MSRKTMYGISFEPLIINNNMVVLRAMEIVEGINYEKKLITKYDKMYSLVDFSTNEQTFKNMYGFGVMESELLDFASKCNIPKGLSKNVDLCVKTYLKSVQEYIYFLERSDNKFYTYGLNLKTKKMIPVQFSKDAISQLDESFSIKDKKKIFNDEENQTYKILNPNGLARRISKRVIGQDEAVFKVATTVCKNFRYNQYEGMKSNILLYGPSGCGKTEIARSLKKEIDVPIVIEDMGPYTASGYIGDSVKKMLRRLYASADEDIKKAEHGIIVLDEIDKLAEPNNVSSSVNKVEVQEELLKIIEGGIFDLNDSNRATQELLMDTSNITFIFSGAFAKFKGTVEHSMGFGKDLVEKKERIMTKKDLIEYGLIPELVGRIGVIAPVKKLEVDDYKKILTTSRISCLKLHEKALLESDKVVIMYNDKNQFINKVAEKAEALGSGARGLKSIVDETFAHAISEVSNEYPNDRVLTISSDTIEDSTSYQLAKRRRGKVYELSERNGTAIK